MTSRLDRLFVLLEAGTGAATRRAAARQLGEVQKAHPEELHRLLGRLMKYLKATAWETRVTASQAVEAILSNVPEWNPPPYNGKKEEEIDPEPSTKLRCETFDIDKVLRNGAHLMGSEGHEYDMEEENLSATDLNDRMTKQRQQLNSRLGLDVASKLGMDISSMYTNEDLCLTNKPSPPKEQSRMPVQELVPLPSSKPLSSREMNLAKRKARQAAFCKQKSRECSEEGPSAPPTPPAEPDRKKIKLEPVEESYVDTGAPTPDCNGSWGDATEWPLENWCSTLQAQLFSGQWEARHGAATALRTLLRSKMVAGAGKKCGMSAEQMEEAHQEWLEDMALRLVCVLALDRFGDFVSDQVIAPVRETCAQTLGVCLSLTDGVRARGVARLLARLRGHAAWEARHGAALALKYLLVARQDVAVESGVLEQLMNALEDPAEDVSAVAAAALAPAASVLAEARPAAVKELSQRVWRLLRSQDELSAPAAAYMTLTGSLIHHPACTSLLNPIELSEVLPRLCRYLDHSSSGVRKATLQALLTVTKPADKDMAHAQNGDVTKAVDYLNWTPELLQEAMRHIFQRILFEHVQEIQEIAYKVWCQLLRHAELCALLVAACPALAAWLCAAVQPARVPLEPALLSLPPPPPPPPPTEPRARSLSQADTLPPEVKPPQKWFIGGSESQPQNVREKNVMRARCMAADALGLLSCYLVQPAPGIEYKAEDESPIDCYVKVLIVYIRSGSALQRLVSSLVTSYWARHSRRTRLFPRAPPGRNGAVDDFSKMASPAQNGAVEDVTKMTTLARNGTVDDVIKMAPPERNGVVDDVTKMAPPALVNALHTSLNQALYYDEVALNCNRILQEARDLQAMMKHYKLPVDIDDFNNILRLEQVSELTEASAPMISSMKCKRVSRTLEERRCNLHHSVRLCLAEQVELNVQVQAALAGACANLHCLPEKLNPVIRPLMESLKKEPSAELQKEAAQCLAELVAQLASREPCPNNKVLANLKAFLSCDPEYTPRVKLSPEGAEITSAESGQPAEGDASPHALDQYNGMVSLWQQRRAADVAPPRRGRPPAAPPAPPAAAALAAHDAHDEAQKLLKIQRRGASLALTRLTEHFGADLPQTLPKLWEFITQPFVHEFTEEELESTDVEAAEELISRLQVFECVCPSLEPRIWKQVSWRRAATLTRHRLAGVRHMAARSVAAAAKRDQTPKDLVTQLIPWLSDMGSARGRCGAAEAVALTADALQLHMVPYIPLFVLPLLGRMSDPCEPVRVMSTRCFATLIQLMPLDGAVPEPEGLTPELRERRDRDKLFLERLFNPKTIEDYKVPVPINAQLRTYQQAGVNWLRFLSDFGLHGVLCDDMGLGKTLQCICVLAGSHHERPAASSLVVCPPTLTGHWVFEVNKFVPSNHLRPLQYVGPPVERERLRTQVQHYNLVIASYDIVRKDIDFFSSIEWNYCILDEGHVIKNGKTKAFKAVKQLIANHRLILSGTPIQNNVLELWSLFEFLMPGLLGSERQFGARYGRPILQAREARAPPLAAQHAALACEALHRQVLPFLLRRVKEDVLKELPPKITQDYYCELSPLQRRLYEDFSRAHMPQGLDTQHAHVFQALHYLQSVCNHPKLVLASAHPEAERVSRQLAADGSSLDDIHHAAKLPALKQLLLDCGIGASTPETEADTIVSQHRALIFCQLKKMLDIVEQDLLKKHLPSVSYLRLDGSVPPASRHAIVTAFNNDPTIDVLLLTTKVGGLGLNLTGADTVIFVEHDWNPMRDLQAMDRAHRIGQRRVVNVYRLVTRDTLEEKIMGLQKFKLQTANTVISSENAAIETMGTEQLLDIVQTSNNPANPAQTSGGSVLDSLPDLWDDRQYDEEYDMTAFIKALKDSK